jgi:GTP cyclohydrolase II
MISGLVSIWRPEEIGRPEATDTVWGDMSGNGKSGLFGNPEQVAVERGIAEFRSERPIIMTAREEVFAVLPVDGMTEERLASFRSLCAPAQPRLVITGRRAKALGIESTGPVGLAVGDLHSAATIFSLAADTQVTRKLDVVPAGEAGDAAVALAKFAQRLPALLISDGKAAAAKVGDPPLIKVEAEAVERFRKAAVASLAIAAEATIPLNGALSARFVIFRDSIGGTPTAIVVGRPDFAEPVAVRMHSACLTGDVFGSRRCDCGDQLRLALSQLAQYGGGVILYLEQEGRGLGLANKIRTYQLQDAGLDTVDANTVLGFDDDERDYGVAVRMLQMLGCTRVRLLTNNPSKLDGLAHAGIDVSGRVPLQGPVNPDNRRYLTAKATRAGHQLDHLFGTFAEVSENPRKPVGSGQSS